MSWFSKTDDYDIDNYNLPDDIRTTVSYDGEVVGGSHDHVEDNHRHHTDYVCDVGHNSYDYDSNPANRYDEHYTSHED